MNAKAKFTGRPKGRVLVVDDDRDIADSIGEILQEQAYEVIVSTADEKVLKYIENERFDILITDIYMEGLSGYELISLARQKGIEKVIAISGNSVEWEAKRSGATVFLRKPIVDRDIIKALNMPHK